MILGHGSIWTGEPFHHLLHPASWLAAGYIAVVIADWWRRWKGH